MLEEIKEIVEKEFGLEGKSFDTNVLLIRCERDKLKNLMKLLKEKGFNYPHTVSVVDYTPKEEGFEVNYVLEDIVAKKMVIVRVKLDENDLSIPTVSDIFPALQPHERECWEMFGVNFVGNPRLEVMLLPEWAEGWFPLRKSYDFEKHRKPSKEKK
ncbi:NADH-quinone oxidoreductase subunit C [Desulfurobacterium pacificum]|jgi:NADH-quinone oxidoreductase subunit C|uniref:NADH-quinone oxidoreductase subunit C n=1 Tax=Desulfurobacterium pacificum TaxID=240166 RepID=A0ABY1NKC4_9BACT|nr:NADH-quinone oxidoreductase subunit C [Desulfurobacterium pacificum]SMP11659.1 NADH-quinone oxidoreductase subunit C [Desulfurobacterium pacificum]